MEVLTIVYMGISPDTASVFFSTAIIVMIS